MTLLHKVWGLLTNQERWRLAALCLMVTLVGFVQVASVGSIAPFVSVLVNPESVQTNPWLRFAFESLGFESAQFFLVFLATVVLSTLAISNSLLALTQLMLTRIGWSLQYRLSRSLLEAYLKQPYTAHLERNSSDTGKNVVSEVERLINTVVIPLLRLGVSLVIGLFLIAMLFWADPVLASAAILLLGGGYSIIYLAVRSVLARAGARRMLANTERYKAVNEAIGGVKEIKVLGRETAMLSQYDDPAKRFARAQVTNEVVLGMPRYGIEVLAMGLVMLLALYLVGTAGEPIDSVAALLALYMFAAQRLVPVLQQVYTNVSQLRFNSVVLDAIYDDITKQPGLKATAPMVTDNGARLPFKRELRLDGLTFGYARAGTPAIKNITLSIPYRSFVAVVGSTGAGKTTLVDIILGLMQPDEGKLTVDGEILDHKNIRFWQNNLGYVPQDVYMTDDSIAANIAFGVPPEERIWESIERSARIANIHDFIVDELPNGYSTEIGERGVRMSAGQRQRIGIARALYHDPEVLVLDEATSNLDQGTERNVYKAIEQAAAAKTVIMIAHRLSTTRQCDALYLIEKGCLIAQGSYDTLIRSNERFQTLVGTT